MKMVLNKFADRIERLLPESIRKNSDKIFIAATCAFLILFSCKNTKMELYYPSSPSMILLPAVFIAAILRVIGRLNDFKRITTGLVVTCIYCLVFLFNRTEQSNYSNLVYFGLLTVGCIGFFYEKLLRAWCVVVGSVIIVTFCAASVGSAKNLVYYVGGWRHQIRGSLGVIYPTDCATWVLFFLMILWVAYKRIPGWIMIMLATGSAVFSKLYCDSNTSMICSIMFGLAVIYEVVERKNIRKHRITDILCLMVAPFMSITMFGLIFLYGKGVGIIFALNEKLHGRIRLGWEAIQKYGVKLFGVNFEMHGLGGKLIHDLSKYNFLDCSYVNILIRYGILVFVSVIAMWLFIEWRAIKIGDRRLLFAMAVISIHSFEEHHFMEVIYNPLIIMALADYAPAICENHVQEFGLASRNRVRMWLRDNIGVLAGLFVVAVIIPFLNNIFSVMRTVIDLVSVPSEKPDMVVSLVLIILFLIIFFLLVSGIAKLAHHITKSVVFFALVVILAATITLISCELFISAKSGPYIASLAREKKAVEHIIKANTHPVYIDVLSEIYRREYPVLRTSVFAGADLARYSRATIITDAHTESDCFFNRGYLMTQISDSTVVYSNDEPVLKELEKAGYHITGYYNISREAQIREDGEAIVEDLTGGRYVFSAELELISLENDTSESIGEIKVFTSEDTNANGAEPLYLSDFSDGKAQKDIVCGFAPSPEARLIVDCDDGYEVRLISVVYFKSYEMDVHNYYNDNYQVIRSEYYDADGNRVSASNGASAFEYEYDDAGNQSVIRYYGIDDKPLIVGGGFAEIHRKYDERRRVISESYYGVDGRLKAVASGQASDYRTLDVKGNITIQKYYGVDGKLVLVNSGYAEIHREFDDNDHIIREEYYDTKGKPVTLSSGYAAIDIEYDDQGNDILHKYYNTSGNPTIVSAGYAEIHRKYDEFGNLTEVSYYGMDGHLMIIKSGYAVIRREYDSVGRVIRESYYDTKDLPVALSSGQSSDVREYDTDGNCVRQRYYAVDDAPVMLSKGYAEIHREYNDKKQLIRESYYDASGELTCLKSGQVFTEFKYDEYGNVNGEYYFDMSGRPVVINNGYCGIRRYYDTRKRLYREEYVDTNNDPAVNESGYHAFERKYDEDDRIITEKYFDAKGRPVNIVSGYASIEYLYDKEGQIAARRYIDSAGLLTAEKDSMVAEIRYRYDDMGRNVREEYFGVDGMPVENNHGYALLNNKYNEMGLISEQSYYGINGEPISSDSGYAKRSYEYDQSGQNIAQWYYDVNGDPTTCTDGYYGLRREYNERGAISSQTMVDDEGEPMISLLLFSRSDTEYDAQGRVTCISYYDRNGQPVNTNDGYSKVRRKLDERGRVVKEEYYGTEGELVHNCNHVAAIEREYDNRDNVLQVTYLDTDGIETNNSSGISEYHREYGATDLLVREEQKSAERDRQETAGYDAIIYEYNNKGLNTLEKYVDEKDNPVIIESGYSMIEYGYDDLRNTISKKYLDVSGHCVDNASGVGGVTREYQGRLCVRESFINRNGALTENTSGYCTIQREYDSNRNLISITYLDKNNDPVINVGTGYARVEYEYDEYRNTTGVYYYDTLGKPVTAVNGCTSIQTIYDKDRNVVKEIKK